MTAFLSFFFPSRWRHSVPSTKLVHLTLETALRGNAGIDDAVAWWPDPSTAVGVNEQLTPPPLWLWHQHSDACTPHLHWQAIRSLISVPNVWRHCALLSRSNVGSKMANRRNSSKTNRIRKPRKRTYAMCPVHLLSVLVMSS